MKYRTFAVALLTAVAAAVPLAQSAIDPSINDKIRKEEADHSQVMRTQHFLTDVYGPRLTGSPNHKAAAEWAVKTMTEWGMTNGKLEPWDWNHPGWVERVPGRARHRLPTRTRWSWRRWRGRRAPTAP